MTDILISLLCVLSIIGGLFVLSYFLTESVMKGQEERRTYWQNREKEISKRLDAQLERLRLITEDKKV